MSVCLEYLYEAEGDRLDKYLAEQVGADPEYSFLTRSQIKRIIQAGQVTVNGEVARKAGFFLKPDARIFIELRASDSGELEPWDFKLDIIFEDQDLLVINKPAGVCVHPGAGHRDKTLVNALVYYLGDALKGVGEDYRVGIVHRLDKDTTGLLVVAKNLRTLNGLSEQFADRSIGREYVCLVSAPPRGKEVSRQDCGVIDSPIGRHPTKRTIMAIDEDGRNAVSHWSKERQFPYACQLRVKLETGRTHQIRVHLESIGAAVIGDRQYGQFDYLPAELMKLADNFGRQALHAERLYFKHPKTGNEVSFQVDMPDKMRELIDEFSRYTSS